jgi:hypothetical protein
MASWVLVTCLVSLRNEFNLLSPGRDKASDGSIGDTSHSAGSSDHNPDETGNTPYEDSDGLNEVHAIDVDNDLKKAGWSMTKCVEIIVTRHREGRDNRLQNVIYNRRIWSRSWGWTAREYTGSNAHTEHAHFSARYDTPQENDARPWGLLEAEENDMPTADEVADAVIAKLKAQAGKDAVYDGVNQDRIQKYTTDAQSLVQVLFKPTAEDNGFMTWASALSFAHKDLGYLKALTRKTDDKIDVLGPQVVSLVNMFKQFIIDESARDAQEQARDVAMKNLLDVIHQMQQQPGSVALSNEQFEELQSFLGQKIVEAGRDAADATTWKLNRIAEALAGAGETLGTADDEPPQQ